MRLWSYHVPGLQWQEQRHLPRLGQPGRRGQRSGRAGAWRACWWKSSCFDWWYHCDTRDIWHIRLPDNQLWFTTPWVRETTPLQKIPWSNKTSETLFIYNLVVTHRPGLKHQLTIFYIFHNLQFSSVSWFNDYLNTTLLLRLLFETMEFSALIVYFLDSRSLARRPTPRSHKLRELASCCNMTLHIAETEAFYCTNNLANQPIYNLTWHNMFSKPKWNIFIDYLGFS